MHVLSAMYCRATSDSFVGCHSAPDLRKLMFGYCLLRCWHGDGLSEWAHWQPAEGNGSDSWSMDSR